jgi:hypothetical protein
VPEERWNHQMGSQMAAWDWIEPNFRMKAAPQSCSKELKLKTSFQTAYFRLGLNLKKRCC